jgi:hypothetical protein
MDRRDRRRGSLHPKPPLTPPVRCGQLDCMPRPPVAPSAKISRVLSAADVSARTLRRYLSGVSVLGSTLRRIDAALRAEGLESLIELRAKRVRAQDEARAA